MKQEENIKIIPAPYGFVICAVSTLIAGEELKKLSEFLTLDFLFCGVRGA